MMATLPMISFRVLILLDVFICRHSCILLDFPAKIWNILNDIFVSPADKWISLYNRFTPCSKCCNYQCCSTSQFLFLWQKLLHTRDFLQICSHFWWQCWQRFRERAVFWNLFLRYTSRKAVSSPCGGFWISILPLVAAAAQRYVPATIRSGGTCISAPWMIFPPSIRISSVPSPWILAPIFFKNLHSQIISGSFAQL